MPWNRSARHSDSDRTPRRPGTGRKPAGAVPSRYLPDNGKMPLRIPEETVRLVPFLRRGQFKTPHHGNNPASSRPYSVPDRQQPLCRQPTRPDGAHLTKTGGRNETAASARHPPHPVLRTLRQDPAIRSCFFICRQNISHPSALVSRISKQNRQPMRELA